MKRTLHNLYVSMLTLIVAMTAMGSMTAAAAPQVTAEMTDVTGTTMTIVFTPNADVKEYYVCQFDKGDMPLQYAAFKNSSAMFGEPWTCESDMIKTWGIKNTAKSEKTWDELIPNKEYDYCVASYDANGDAAPIQTFTFKAGNKGGDGASVIGIEVKEFGQEEGAYYQRVVYVPNDQTQRFYDLIITQDGYNEMGGADGVKRYLTEDYDGDSQRRDSYAHFDVDDAVWSADYATKYHACAIGMNANNEWGEMTDVPFATTGYLDPDATSFWWGYGDGVTPGTGNGPSSSATRTAAMKIPADVLAVYDGATLTDVRFAVAGNGSCTKVSYFVLQGRSDDGDAEYELLKTYTENSVNVGTLTTGWHEFHLDTPITIHAGEDIYIGYTATGVQPISIASNKGVAGSCIMKNSGKFIDYGTKDGYDFALACQVKLNSSNLKAAVSLDEIGHLDVETGKPYEVSGRVVSMTPVGVTSFTAQFEVDGKAVKQTTVTCDLSTKDMATPFTMKITSGLSEGDHNYKMSIIAINGKVLDTPTVTEGTITAHDLFLRRRIVYEDITGTWCQYCPRATAGLEALKKAHPNEVIVIAVHKSDDHEISDYAAILNSVSGLPTVRVDRQTSNSGTYAECEQNFLSEKALAIKGESKIVVAQYTDASRSKVELLVDSRFAMDYDSHGFRLSFVVTEDDIFDYQTYAPELGPSRNVLLQDVARAYDCHAGIEGSIPAQLKAGEHYYYRYELAYPDNVVRREKSHIIAMLQYQGGNAIANADIISEIAEPGTYDLDGIDTVLAPSAAPAGIFDLSGRHISAPQRGRVTIQNGRKMIAK